MELSDIRNQIDGIDGQLLELFLRRMELAEDVAAYKKAHGQPILNRSREQEILDRVTARAGERGDYARRLFETLMELSRARQAELIGVSDPDAEN